LCIVVVVVVIVSKSIDTHFKGSDVLLISGKLAADWHFKAVDFEKF